MGSEDEDGGAISRVCSGRAIARNKSVNSVVWHCIFPEDVDEANRLAKTLLLELPLLLEPLLLLLLQHDVKFVTAGVSSKI